MPTPAEIEIAADAIIRCPAFCDLNNSPTACARDMARAALEAVERDRERREAEQRAFDTLPDDYEAPH